MRCRGAVGVRWRSGRGIEGVAQAVADGVDSQHGDEDGQAREVDEVRAGSADGSLGLANMLPKNRREAATRTPGTTTWIRRELPRDREGGVGGDDAGRVREQRATERSWFRRALMHGPPL